MKQQLGFSEQELRRSQHRTRKELFLAKMENLVPWNRLVVLIEPFYPKAGNGRGPYPLESMLRVHCLQQWYNQRDPEMHQTKKGNQWHFGMKAHIGVDVKTGLTHTFTTTSANEHDLNQVHNLLHGEEKRRA